MTDVAKVIQLHGEAGAAFTRSRRHNVSNLPVGLGEVVSITDRLEEANPPQTLSEAVRRRLTRQVTGAAEFLRRRVRGDYRVDDFGFDPHWFESVFLPVMRPLYNAWFRVEVRGIENLPARGAGLVVANHGGVLPLDSLMMAVAVHDLHPLNRPLRTLADHLIFETPFIGPLARKAGFTLADATDAERLLRDGELTAAFPEGFKGVGKPFGDRYKLQRFGRGGYVSAAIRTGAPIIPCSIVGAEETYPKLGDLQPLARLLGLPYFPVTPLFPLLGPLGAIPLPAKWYIEFGEPIRTDSIDPADAEDPIAKFEVTDHVRETIQQALYRLIAKRRSVFLG